MVPETVAIAKTASKAIEAPAQGFLRAVLGEPLVELGGILGDKMRERRHANLINISERAKQRLDRAGVSPRQVPLSVIHPLIAAAANESDPTLQEHWANLLANAADPRGHSAVLPAFPFILRELNGDHARFAEALYDARSELDYEDALAGFDIQSLAGIYGRANGIGSDETEWKDGQYHQFRIAVDQLIRAQVLGAVDNVYDANAQNGGSPEVHAYSTVRRYQTTPLGHAFLNAVRAPSKS